MALYGSSVANLSPILFRGNLFSEGVNLVFYTDISYSMNFDPNGNVNYDSDRPNLGNIGAGSTTSMFYDGIFGAKLQTELLNSNVGNSSPNLYTYFDQTLRVKTGTQDVVLDTEVYRYSPSVIIADSNYSTSSKLKDLWVTDYIDRDQGLLTPGTTNFNIASKISGSTANRFSGFDLANNPGQFSEDVHGNLWSLYYCGSTGANRITDGLVNDSSSFIGRYLNSLPRKDLTTFVIAASNEQENTASNLAGIGITTKNNVGYTTSKYNFGQPGFYARRYDHYYLDDEFNGGVSVQTTGGGSYGTLNFENWFTGVAEGGLPPAQPLPFGLIDPSLWTGVDLFGNVTAPTIVDGQPVFITGGTNEDAPGLNWYVDGNGEEGPGDVNLEGTQIVDWENTNITATNSGYADIAIPNHPYAGNSARYGPTKRAFWGPINYIDRLRSDIADYSLMIIGYFSPQFSSGETGTVKFKLQSNGVSCLWIGSDSLGNSTNDAILSSSIDDDGFGEQSKVYNGWTIDNATIACPSNAADQYDILSRVQSRNDVFEEESVDLQMTAGRYYPFRLIVGNPNVASNTFSQGGVNQPNLQLSDSNPSFLRLLFDVGDGYRVDGNGFFFGGTEVWEEGSPFFPPNVEIVERTIEEELKYRNTRVISLASYDSTDGYDAVFVKDVDAVPPKYMYVNLDEFDFTFIESNNSPLSGGWGVGRYFDPIEFRIEDDDSNFSRQANTITGVIPVGTGASFTINKFNDRYITDVSVGGTGYTIGDRFTINFSALGETNVDNNLVLDVTEVEALSYNIITTSADNFVERSITNATFNVQKNLNSNNTYTVDLVDSGSEYQIDDKLLISGLDLDGGSANDLIITVNSILGSGEVDTFTVSGTPSQLINYNVNLNSYKPLPANFTYEPTDIDTIEYRTSFNSGIAYTTAAITGIAYSTLTGTGIGHSTFDIIGIAYTQIDNEETTKIGIAYSTANITGISYTTSTVTGLAYTFANVTGVAYSGEQITGVGYTSLQVVSIGYTSPNLTSIGYTAFQISSIDYDGKIGISSIELFEDGSPPTNPDNAEIYVELTGNTTLFSGIQEILIDGTGQPALDSSLGAGIHTTTLIASEDGSGQQWRFQISQINDSLISEDSGTIFTPGAFLIALNDPQTAAAGFGSTATVTTTQEHTFVDGDIINIVGVTGDTGNDTEFNDVFTIEQVLSTTSFTLQNSGTVGLFTGTAIGAGGTVGYDQAELELEIPFSIETESVGITSIYYEELYKQYSAATSRPRFFLNADPYNAGTLVEFDLEGDPGVQWNGQTASDITNFGEYVGIGSVVYLFFDDGNGDISSDATPRPLDYRQLGYGHTVVEFRGANNRRFGVETPNGYAGNTQNIPQGGYWIVGGDTPIVTTDSSLPESFVDGKVVTISGNNNADYNNEWQILNATTDSFELADRSTGIASTATDLLTPSSTFDAPGAANAGTASSEFTDVAYRFEVGLGITVFGVTGESAIYNDGYTIIGIKSSTPSIDNTPYAFILKENQTPTELALQGTSGKIGIHTISGIATVAVDTFEGSFLPGSSSPAFALGAQGDVIPQLKIQGTGLSNFDKIYNNVTILDGTRILLGDDSFRNEDTTNPEENADPTIGGSSVQTTAIGSKLNVVFNNSDPKYPYTAGEQIRIYGTTNFDAVYTIAGVYDNAASVNKLELVEDTALSGDDVSLYESGDFGIRDLGPIITASNASIFTGSDFGSIGDVITIKLQDIPGKPNLNYDENGGVTFSAEILDNTSGITLFLDDSNAHNPIQTNAGSGYTSYTGAAGIATVGYVGGEYKLQSAINAPEGSSLRIQDAIDQNGITLIGNIVFSVSERIGNIYRLNGVDSTTATVFGRVASTGLVGLIENALVTTSSDHPFVEGDDITIQDTTGNSGIFNNTFTNIQYVSSTSFILRGTNTGGFTNDFNDADATGGLAGLRDYPATVTYTGHPFEDGATVRVENIGIFGATFDDTISVIDANRFTLPSRVNPTDFSDISNETLDSDALITLTGTGPEISVPLFAPVRFNLGPYDGGPNSFFVGDQIRIQGTTNFDGVYTITNKYATERFTINKADPADFDTTPNEGSGGIIGDIGSKLYLRYSPSGVIINAGQTIRIQGSTGGFDGIYTVDLDSFGSNSELELNRVSTATTDFNLANTNNFTIGLENYPATATFSASIPASYTIGSQIDIKGVAGDDVATSVELSLPGPYTIAWRNDASNTLGLLEATNPSDYTVTENNGGSGYIAGLRNSPARITFSDLDFLEGAGTVSIGNRYLVNISETDNFDGNATIQYVSSNTFQFVSPSFNNPTDYIPDGDISGLVGLANSNATVLTSGFHNLTVGESIYINTGDNSIQSIFGGTRTVDQILDVDKFTISGTENPSDYSVDDIEGYFVIEGRGLRANLTSDLHIKQVGDTVSLDVDTNDALDGNKIIQEVLNSSQLRLNGTYPSPITDGFGRPNYQITDTGTITPLVGLANGGSFGNASVRIQRLAQESASNFEYNIVQIINSGNAYEQGEKYLITGNLLGGASPANDAIVTIGNTNDPVGGITGTNIVVSGSIDPTLDYQDSTGNPILFTSALILGDGQNADITIVRKGERDPDNVAITTYSEVTINSGGTGYVDNQVIKIAGNRLGGTTPENDLFIYTNTIPGDSLVGSAITFRGESRNSAPLISSGLSTVYLIGPQSFSRPYGLEEVWETPGTPPPNQGELKQTHDMLSLAEANKGAVIKIDRVYNRGSIEKYAEIEHITFFPVVLPVHANIRGGNPHYEGSILTDSGGNSGICTLLLDNNASGGSESTTKPLELGEAYVLTSSHEHNPLATINYIDYRNVGIVTIIGLYEKQVDNEPGLDPVTGGGFVNLTTTSGTLNHPVTGSKAPATLPTPGGWNGEYAFGTGVHQIVFQTPAFDGRAWSGNYTDGPVGGFNNLDVDGSIRYPNEDAPSTGEDYGVIFAIVSAGSTLTVRTKSPHNFVNGDLVTLRYSYNPLGDARGNKELPHNGYQSEPFGPSSGIGFTTYEVRTVIDDNGVNPLLFQCFDPVTGLGVSAGKVLPSGDKLIDLVAESFIPSPTDPPAYESLTPTLIHGGVSGIGSDTVYDDFNYGFGSIDPTNYQYTGGYTEYRVTGADGKTAEDEDVNSAYSHIRIAVGGEAFVVGAGITPIDNRVGLAKAIAKFIADTSET